jgi:hypothetical protein
MVLKITVFVPDVIEIEAKTDVSFKLGLNISVTIKIMIVRLSLYMPRNDFGISLSKILSKFS